MEKIIVCVCVCVNSTLGWCCDCCKKEETLYFKIDKTAQGEVIKKCFNNTWYNKCKNKVLSLQQVNENGSDVLKVTGSDNKWEITDSLEKVLENADCNPDNNKWIIVKVITWNSKNKKAGDSFIFYVDEITLIQDNAFSYGVFENIRCYSIDIIAANTSAVESMKKMFFKVKSALEQNGKGDTTPGLIGLDKLNIENVEDIGSMFFNTIHKQATLDQLKGWRFSKSSVRVTNLFHATVAGLDFTILNGWRNAKKCGTVSFTREHWSTSEKVFVKNGNKNDFTAPKWYNYIKEVK